jgi:hypothetical protein
MAGSEAGWDRAGTLAWQETNELQHGMRSGRTCESPLFLLVRTRSSGSISLALLLLRLRYRDGASLSPSTTTARLIHRRPILQASLHVRSWTVRAAEVLANKLSTPDSTLHSRPIDAADRGRRRHRPPTPPPPAVTHPPRPFLDRSSRPRPPRAHELRQPAGALADRLERAVEAVRVRVERRRRQQHRLVARW